MNLLPSFRRVIGVLAVATLGTLARADSTAFDSLVEAERGFAAASVERGMKAAFLENMTDDAVLFRAGPLNGVRLWRARGESPAVLDWAPSFAEISGWEDMGFTTGPWTLAESKDAAPASFGHFVTVWRRQGDGPWRVAVDLGISHEDPRTSLRPIPVKRGPHHVAPDTNEWRGFNVGVGGRYGNVFGGASTSGGGGVGFSSGGFGVGVGTGGDRSRYDYEWRKTAHEKNELMSSERDLAFMAKSKGWDAAYRKLSAGDLRVYRDGLLPDLSPEAAIELNAQVPVTREWVTRGHGVAASWDLGYTYGIAVSRVKGAPPDSVNFLHLWRKDDAWEWRLMMDVESPFPKRR